MTTYTADKLLPIQQKVFTVTSGLTFREFIEQFSGDRHLLRSRVGEVRVPPAIQDTIVTYPDILNMVLLVSEEAPETMVILPIIVRLAQLSPRILLRILRETDDLSMLEAAVEDLDLEEEIDLPLLLIFDEEWNWQAQWGPRPAAAEPYLDRWLETHSDYETLAEDETPAGQAAYVQRSNLLLHEMRVWYNSGLNQACIQEIYEVLGNLREDEESVN